MKLKHTPGPWNYADEESGEFCIYEVKTKNILCDRGEWPNRRVESLANARLIAAAPEMLEMLIELSDHTDIIGTEVQERIYEIVRSASGLAIDEVIV